MMLEQVLGWAFYLGNMEKRDAKKRRVPACVREQEEKRAGKPQQAHKHAHACTPWGQPASPCESMHHTQGTVRTLTHIKLVTEGFLQEVAQRIVQRGKKDSLWTGVQSHKLQGILLVYNFLSWKTGTNYKLKETVGSNQSDSICRLILKFQEGADLPKVTKPFRSPSWLQGEGERN